METSLNDLNGKYEKKLATIEELSANNATLQQMYDELVHNSIIESSMEFTNNSFCM